MKKRLIFILFMLIVTIFVFSSCVGEKNSSSDNVQKSNNDDIIQLWYYNYNDSKEPIDKLVKNAQAFCAMNNIPLEVHTYSDDVMSLDDYILKRNIAANSGNVIILDVPNNLQSLAKGHADYTKLENYNYLLNSYKDKFCIPLGVYYNGLYIENQIFNHYGINTSDKPLITYSDYLIMKQEMKENGAKFTLNYREFYELVNYYLNINDLLFINGESEIVNDDIKLKETLKKSILDVCSDILMYNNGQMDVDIKVRELYAADIYYLYSDNIEHIFDETSQLVLRGNTTSAPSFTMQLDLQKVPNISNKIFIIDPNSEFFMRCFYMSKKITNNKIYDLANHLVSEESYFLYKGSTGQDRLIPVMDKDVIRQELKMNENWEYAGESRIAPEIKRVMNTAYNFFMKDEEKSKEIAKYNLADKSYCNDISIFVEDTIIEIAKKISIDEVSLEKFDPNSEEINKLINDKIDDFIINLKIKNN